MLYTEVDVLVLSWLLSIKGLLVTGDSAVVLFIHKEDDRYNFQITVHNLKDKAGNLISDEKKLC